MEPSHLPLQHGGKTPPHGDYTWDDFVALPDDDHRELIDGELVELEVPNEIHEHIVMMLGFFLVGWVRARKAGRVLGSGYKVRVSEKRGVMPDVQVFRTGNTSNLAKEGLTKGAPDLAVEIISSSSETYDRVTKLAWYARIGVAEYWIVSPETRTLERLVLHESAYVMKDTVSDDDTFRPDSFPGLEIPLAELWVPPEGAPQED
jgi:Uma2 family endonuclease